MNSIGLIILTFLMSDSTTVVSVVDTFEAKESVVFKQVDENMPELRYKYKHQQGFFCDFEDKINEKRKLNLNLGVGDQ